MFYPLFSILLISSRLFGAAAASQPSLNYDIKELIPSKVHGLSQKIEGLSRILKLHKDTSRGAIVAEVACLQEERRWRDAVFIDLKTNRALAKAPGAGEVFGNDHIKFIPGANIINAHIKFIPGANIMICDSNDDRRFKLISDSLHEPKYKIFDGNLKLCAYNDSSGQREALLAVGCNDKNFSTVTLFKYNDLQLHTKSTSVPKRAKDNAKKITIEGCKINDVQFSDDGELLVVYADNYDIEDCKIDNVQFSDDGKLLVAYADNYATSHAKVASKLLLYKIGKDVSKEVTFDLDLRKRPYFGAPEKCMHLTENNNTVFIHANEWPDKDEIIFSGGGVRGTKGSLYELSCDTGICKKLLCFCTKKNAFCTDNAGMQKVVDILNAHLNVLILAKGAKIYDISVKPNKTGSLIVMYITAGFAEKIEPFFILLRKYFGKKKIGYKIVGIFVNDIIHTVGDRLGIAFDEEEGTLYLSGFGRGKIAVFDGIANIEIPLLQNRCAALIRGNKNIDRSVLPKVIQDRFNLHCSSTPKKRPGADIVEEDPKKPRLPQS